MCLSICNLILEARESPGGFPERFSVKIGIPERWVLTSVRVGAKRPKAKLLSSMLSFQALLQDLMLRFRVCLPVSNNMTKKIPTGDFLVGFRCSSSD